MSSIAEQRLSAATPLSLALGDEGLRLFFPLSALYCALWPFQWVLVFSLDLPFARTTPPALWHAHEMIFGAFGAALIGFITTAVPEWTDTPRLRGRPLFVLAALWGCGRLVGFLGADFAGALGALCDLAWLSLLVAYMVHVSFLKRTDRLLAFIGWITALAVCEAAVRACFHFEEIELAGRLLRISGLVFVGLLGVALARITVPVTNLVLDPTETTSPFRPHPGRLNLAPGLIAIAVVVDLAGFSETVCGYTLIAAGAGFMDRAGEVFIGRSAFRAEVACLAGSSLFAGTGLLLVGATQLGAPISPVTGLHVAFMGGLGLGVLAVFCIAGLLHTGHSLAFSRTARWAMLCLVVAVALRVLPDLDLIPQPPGPPYAFTASFWAAAFLLWLKDYWPRLRYAFKPCE